MKLFWAMEDRGKNLPSMHYDHRLWRPEDEDEKDRFSFFSLLSLPGGLGACPAVQSIQPQAIGVLQRVGGEEEGKGGGEGGQGRLEEEKEWLSFPHCSPSSLSM
jgi:hypothetical protein